MTLIGSERTGNGNSSLLKTGVSWARDPSDSCQKFVYADGVIWCNAKQPWRDGKLRTLQYNEDGDVGCGEERFEAPEAMAFVSDEVNYALQEKETKKRD